jgi:hypothetical protein
MSEILNNESAEKTLLRTEVIDGILGLSARVKVRLTLFYGYERSAHAASFC